MSKKIFKVEGMDCDACAKLIELDLEDAGITASCNYATEKLEIETTDNEQEKKVKEVIEKSGYSLVLV